MPTGLINACHVLQIMALDHCRRLDEQKEPSLADTLREANPNAASDVCACRGSQTHTGLRASLTTGLPAIAAEPPGQRPPQQPSYFTQGYAAQHSFPRAHCRSAAQGGVGRGHPAPPWPPPMLPHPTPHPTPIPAAAPRLLAVGRAAGRPGPAFPALAVALVTIIPSVPILPPIAIAIAIPS